jgi:superfamily II DNA or RNA helicase
MTKQIRLPAVFAINQSFRGNTTQQMLIPPITIQGTIANYQANRFKSKVVVPIGGEDDRILLVDRVSSAAHNLARTIRVGAGKLSDDSKLSDLTEDRWLAHPALVRLGQDGLDRRSRLQAVIDSWGGAFSYVAEEPERGIKGLRTPQIGAVHIVHGHWSVSKEIGTIVMPTGTGKTETMLSILVSRPCPKVLVVVPTDALRTQLANKFLTLGILKDPESRVLSERALYPVVGILRHKPRDFDEVDTFFGDCHVIVTTSHIAGQCTEQIQERIARHCPFLFIDEAHHAEAPTWRSFKEKFDSHYILQFTATPFREDGKHLDGKIIYKYPLRKAQEEGYFKSIRFEPVIAFNPAESDVKIAEKAVEQLRRDRKYNHILMARVESVERTREVFPLYQKYKEFNPVQLHTGIKSISEREETRRKILSGESKIVVCVDMLGEGFDLPELKIAAFHDIRKSLAVTLQLAGRFTRARSDLGEPTFIANVAEVDVQDELRKLYTRDPDWNYLLPELSESVIDAQVSLKEFLDGFASFPEDIPLKRMRPATSTVIYKTKCDDWTPENFKQGIPGSSSLERIHWDVNHAKKTLVVVTAKRVRLDWADIEEIYNWDWELYVVIWDDTQKLLFINNSSNEGEFKALAKAVAGEDVELINEQPVFRSFAGVNRLRLQNVGLTEQLGRLVRYTGRMGADVGEGLTEAQKRNARKAVLSGTGFEDGGKVTVGASRKGRIWSFRREHIEALMEWCKSIGRKVLDESIDPDEILKGTLESITVSALPAVVPIGIDWPELIYKEPETAFSVVVNGSEGPLHHTEISLADAQVDGELRFEIVSTESRVQMSLKVFEKDLNKDYLFSVVDGQGGVFLKHRSALIPLEDFFYEDPPVFWFVDGSSLEGNTFTALKTQYAPYDRGKISAWDWAGVDLRKESQGLAKAKDTIQYRVIEELKKGDYDVIFDDDGPGEAADVVAIRGIENSDTKEEIEVEFYHCKYSKKDPGRRIEDMYEVCGQAQKSIRWMYSHEKQVELFSHMLRREPKKGKLRKATRFEKGDEDQLVTIREMARIRPLRLRIFIVQPGLSKSNATVEQLELLSVTENHLMETYKLKFNVIASS